MWLLLQPPAEILPTPPGHIVPPALGDFDILGCFFQHHHYMAGGTVVPVQQIPGPDILPAGIHNTPPGKLTKGSVRTQHGPARAGVAVAIGPVKGIVGDVGRGIIGTGGVMIPQGPDRGPHGIFRQGGGGGRGLCRWRHLLFIVGVWVDVNAVGGTIISHAEVNGLPNVPEFYKIISVNLIRLKLDGLAAEIKGLGGRSGGEIVYRRCRGAA